MHRIVRELYGINCVLEGEKEGYVVDAENECEREEETAHNARV